MRKFLNKSKVHHTNILIITDIKKFIEDLLAEITIIYSFKSL